MKVRFQRKSRRNTAITAKFSRLRRAIPQYCFGHYLANLEVKIAAKRRTFFGGKNRGEFFYPSPKVKNKHCNTSRKIPHRTFLDTTTTKRHAEGRMFSIIFLGNVKNSTKSSYVTIAGFYNSCNLSRRDRPTRVRGGHLDNISSLYFPAP